MTIELIVSDWEGCVAEPQGGRVPWPSRKLADLAAIIQQIEAPFVLCTGRQLPYTEAAVQEIGSLVDIPSIAENGAVLYFPKTKKVLLNPLITPEVQEKLNEVRRKAFKLIDSLGGNREYGKEFAVTLNPPPGVSIQQFYRYVYQQLSEFSEIIEINHSRAAIDITPKGVNKGSGVKFLAEVTGINLANVIAIGDAQGDLAMLREVGHPTCPANADQCVKDISEYVSPYRTTDGVIDIIHHFLEVRAEVDSS